MRHLLTLLLLGCLSAASAQDTFHKSILEPIQNNLVSANKQPVEAKKLASKKLLFVYFSAHWCPPCRKFTPKLVEFYNKNVGKGDFDLLFVSSDKSLDAMYEYMSETKMPWTAIKHGDPEIAALKKRFAVTGIPCLVLLDENDKVLASSFEKGQYMGPQVALEKYETLRH